MLLNRTFECFALHFELYDENDMKLNLCIWDNVRTDICLCIKY